jgi:hypothetical protein
MDQHYSLGTFPRPLLIVAREARSRVLADVVPAFREVFHEWTEISAFVGDSAESIECLEHQTVHFLVRLLSNAYDADCISANSSWKGGDSD